jgi:hypothetical protein
MWQIGQTGRFAVLDAHGEAMTPVDTATQILPCRWELNASVKTSLTPLQPLGDRWVMVSPVCERVGGKRLRDSAK